MQRDKGVRLSRSSAKRMFEVSRYVEQQPRSTAPSYDGPSPAGVGIMLLTTTQVGRGSGPTPGTGWGKIQKFNGTTYSNLSTTAYPILNDTDSLVGSGAYALCLPGPGGKFHFVITSCRNLS